MIFINVLFMFGNVSLSTPATFLLMRSWQGKALFSNLALPMIFWLFLLMFEDVSAVNEAAGTKEKLKITAPCWIMLALVNVLSCICLFITSKFKIINFIIDNRFISVKVQ